MIHFVRKTPTELSSSPPLRGTACTLSCCSCWFVSCCCCCCRATPETSDEATDESDGEWRLPPTGGPSLRAPAPKPLLTPLLFTPVATPGRENKRMRKAEYFVAFERLTRGGGGYGLWRGRVTKGGRGHEGHCRHGARGRGVEGGFFQQTEVRLEAVLLLLLLLLVLEVVRVWLCWSAHLLRVGVGLKMTFVLHSKRRINDEKVRPTTTWCVGVLACSCGCCWKCTERCGRCEAVAALLPEDAEALSNWRYGTVRKYSLN